MKGSSRAMKTIGQILQRLVDIAHPLCTAFPMILRFHLHCLMIQLIEHSDEKAMSIQYCSLMLQTFQVQFDCSLFVNPWQDRPTRETAVERKLAIPILRELRVVMLERLHRYKIL